MDQKVFLFTPPFTQLNTPYPATAYIKGYLNTLNIVSRQADLGIEVIHKLFSSSGLKTLFESLDVPPKELDENCHHIYQIRHHYINTIDSVIQFLQDQDPTLAYLICERQFLPEASRFKSLEELDWAFGTLGIRDKARHFCTLYLEDLSDFIVRYIDPHFGFSRYAERISLSANSFDELYKELALPNSYILTLTIQCLKEKIESIQPSSVCMSVPFPGNLFAALKCGQWLKNHYPEIKIILGGGYPNTELRSIQDPRVFEFVDYISLDDGETPLRNLLEHLQGNRDITMLKRTFTLVNNEVVYHNGSLESDVKQEKVGTPDYSDLPLKKYLSVIQLANPMHRLWSDGRWNKLTMAHGCYWGKCTFCDISLDYIKNYEASSAKLIVDRMEALIEQTAERGFHFVDEAAPPALMKEVALEILARELTVNWWTNIRFEKSFNYDLCRILAASGCIAVSGGLEVASDRLLNLIKKGVTVEQVTQVTNNFTTAGVMVHAYLMYGFPTQTAQETVDSLEVVRQLFEAGVLQSGFWHRFAMTAHSPVGLNPEKFQVINTHPELGAFANNDLEHEDPTGCDHALYSAGLKKSLFNFMHGVCLDFDLQDWFDHPIPMTSHPSDLIESYLSKPSRKNARPESKLVWIGGPLSFTKTAKGPALTVYTKQGTSTVVGIENQLGLWLTKNLSELTPTRYANQNYQSFKASFEEAELGDFTLFWYGPIMEQLKNLGLLIL